MSTKQTKSKPEFAMSMFASRADLFEAKAEYFEQELVKLRNEIVLACDRAGKPPAYMQPSDHDSEAGKEFAYSEVVTELNRILGNE